VQDEPVLECVVNVSEGRRLDVLDAIVAAGDGDLLDVHRDPFHNRAVVTLVGEEAPRAVTRAAVQRLDARTHEGVHPRLGVVDVVPFVPLAGRAIEDALQARDAFAAWAAEELGVPCFLYGPERSLPEIRRQAWRQLAPDVGPRVAHETAGACCVGARGVLVAYNVYLASAEVGEARRVAAAIRGSHLRALGLAVGERVQVSMNLIDPGVVGPAEAYDEVAALTVVTEAELVGLVPRSVLDAVPRSRWAQLGLDEDQTIEARLAERSRRLRGRPGSSALRFSSHRPKR
jgi:glutamate formiminotransferase